jgi:hypothetical protein
LDNIENEMNNLKTKHDIKKLEISQLSSKLDEKNKILNEAKKAYSKVFFIYFI